MNYMFKKPNLDPNNWDDFASLAADFIQQEIKALADSTNGPVWERIPEEVKAQLDKEALPLDQLAIEQVLEQYKSLIRPYRTGNTHPKFWGWVHGTGNPAALLADVAVSSMNSNCGGRDHGATYIERQVINWCKQLFGFSEQAGGLLTSGTSHSSLMALQVALYDKFGEQIKRKGLASLGQTVRFYTSIEAHSSLKKSIETLGVGSDNLIGIATDKQHRISVTALEQQILSDIDNGFTPIAIIANAGTVNAGAFDDLLALAKLKAAHNCWLHVDGAFGAWLTLAEQTQYKQLVSGIEQADSLAFDFHKFMSIQYDCAGLIIHDADLQQQVFSSRPDYLSPHGAELAGGEPWYCDYGIELSRPFRALKVWFTFKTYGLDKLGKAVDQSCLHAHYLASLIEQSDEFECLIQPASNIVCFKLANAISAEDNNAQCEQIASSLQKNGEAVFSLTRFAGYRYIRAAFVNHRTAYKDIDEVFELLMAFTRQ